MIPLVASFLGGCDKPRETSAASAQDQVARLIALQQEQWATVDSPNAAVDASTYDFSSRGPLMVSFVFFYDTYSVALPKDCAKRGVALSTFVDRFRLANATAMSHARGLYPNEATAIDIENSARRLNEPSVADSEPEAMNVYAGELKVGKDDVCRLFETFSDRIAAALDYAHVEPNRAKELEAVSKAPLTK